MRFQQNWEAAAPQNNQLCLTWTGQAGFLIKTADVTILIDPYLTDSVYRQLKGEYGYGFKRMAPALFAPEEIAADYLLVSHEHGDHLDCEAIIPLMDNEKTILYTNEDAAALALEAGVSGEKTVVLRPGSRVELNGFTLSVLAADHGELAPRALGFLLDFNFIKIYYSGDTAYNMQVLGPAAAYGRMSPLCLLTELSVI